MAWWPQWTSQKHMGYTGHKNNFSALGPRLICFAFLCDMFLSSTVSKSAASSVTPNYCMSVCSPVHWVQPPAMSCYTLLCMSQTSHVATHSPSSQIIWSAMKQRSNGTSNCGEMVPRIQWSLSIVSTAHQAMRIGRRAKGLTHFTNIRLISPAEWTTSIQWSITDVWQWNIR